MRRAGPSRAGDAALDRLQRLGAERARAVAQAAAAAGTAPHPPFAFAFPLLPPRPPRGSLHPASLSLPSPAHPGTGALPWRRWPRPARLKHLAGATRLVATALSAVVRGCRVGCDFGRPSGCGSPLPPARGLESRGPLSEGEEGEPGAPGDPEVPAPPPGGCEPTAEEVG